MPKKMQRCSVKCPYYKCDERFEIYCKGPMEGTSMHMAFSIPMEKKNWMDEHCKDDFEKCPIVQVLEAAEE